MVKQTPFAAPFAAPAPPAGPPAPGLCASRRQPGPVAPTGRSSGAAALLRINSNGVTSSAWCRRPGGSSELPASGAGGAHHVGVADLAGHVQAREFGPPSRADGAGAPAHRRK